MRAERIEHGIRIIDARTGNPVHDGREAAQGHSTQEPDAAFRERMFDWYRGLGTQRQDAVLRELIAIAASSDSSPDDVDGST